MDSINHLLGWRDRYEGTLYKPGPGESFTAVFCLIYFPYVQLGDVLLFVRS